ncbi:cyclin-dependent protein kinase inhibitor SMR4-like [Magnolia sinica]|uniref:cyclin-dependent protein kinase inhibitor SMR4-like n=1 Tax=Magnolia sinica TaxID=86752 RepID=UPI00265B4C4F|nr:cyclin-dependent protein kinase inhibitor SMR4-like [Magnolia sinica]
MASIYITDGQPSSGTFSKHVESPKERREGESFSTDGEKTEMDMWSDESCRTPTAKESRIPEVLTCPPAPRKRRSDRFTRIPSVKEYFLPPNLDAVFAEVSKVN